MMKQFRSLRSTLQHYVGFRKKRGVLSFVKCTFRKVVITLKSSHDFFFLNDVSNHYIVYIID